MDPSVSAKLDEINTEVSSAINEVDAALESDDEARELSAGDLVHQITRRYRETIATLPPKEREQVEWKLGKRVQDLGRAAEALSKRPAGQAVAMAKDAGAVPFLEQREPPKSIEPPRANPLLAKKLSVGAAIDAWCGKCKEIREHHIVALVGDEPKQVVCQMCSSRHNFRSEPPVRARSALGIPAGSTSQDRKRVEEDRKANERQEARRALQKELQDAPNPRQFDPKGRYKSGEIIVHPEHGRGKIENVLRSSLLVRFLEGLRPLDLS